MSGGKICRCSESKIKPIADRAWRVVDYRCNYSLFNGGHYTPSDYSALTCGVCDAVWRSKGAYVLVVTHLSKLERAAYVNGTLGSLILKARAMKAAQLNEKPCKHCPYLRDSLPGYFGGNDISQYEMPIRQDIPLACHKTIVEVTKPTGKPEGEHICRGLVYTRINSGKMGESPLYVESEKNIKASTTPEERGRCFPNSREFEKYHQEAFDKYPTQNSNE